MTKMIVVHSIIIDRPKDKGGRQMIKPAAKGLPLATFDFTDDEITQIQEANPVAIAPLPDTVETVSRPVVRAPARSVDFLKTPEGETLGDVAEETDIVNNDTAPAVTEQTDEDDDDKL